MAVPGYRTRVLLGDIDVSGFYDQVDTTRERNIIEVTPFNPASPDVPDREYLAGRAMASLALKGFWDPAVAASDPLESTAFLAGTLQVATVAWEGGNTIGDRAYLIEGFPDSEPMNVSADDALRLSASRQGSGTGKGGVILHPQIQRTTPANYASVDNAASSAFGAFAHLHVTQFVGTDATIVVADSADDAAFASLITFTTATGVTNERVAATGTVNRYARVELSGTFTSLTFTVGFARLNL